jgi:hypothetical protein
MNDIITNGTEIKLRILTEINKSQKSIFLAMAFFTDKDIANAIIEARKRNVFVDIILSSNAQNEVVKQLFLDSNIKIHAFETGDERGMMHHKFCLIDNKITINGSYNYSYNASNNNVENIHVSDDYSIYKQFLTEFERLKYNIDNNLAVNLIVKQNNIMDYNNKTGHVESFLQQLYNLVYLSVQVNTDDYKKKGFEKSRESGGSVEIFKAEYNNIQENIRLYEIDDTLLGKKGILTSDIKNAFEVKKNDIEESRKSEIDTQNVNIEHEKNQIINDINQLKVEKSSLEIGHHSTSERGLLQINKDLERNKLEINLLEKSFVIKKFGSIGNILIMIFLAICFFYLSIFFASALYKVFFEGNLIKLAMESGLRPDSPQIIDANAAVKIFQMQQGGAIFGVISILIFLFPLSLTNLNILGSKNKIINIISFWVGLVIFDILVSFMVAINTDKINSLLEGRNSTLQFWDVVKTGEFYLIFIFGMLPLFITHNLINNITSAYRNSRRELLDAEKNKALEILEREKIDLDFEKDSFVRKILEKEEKIQEKNSLISLQDKKLLEIKNSIDSKYSNILNQIKVIFDEYCSKISSGRIFTDVILDSIVSAFKTGFIEYLPVLYSDQEVSNRVREIDNVITENKL